MSQRIFHIGRRLVFMALAMVAAIPALADELEIIDLHFRRADDIIPIVLPLLEQLRRMLGWFQAVDELVVGSAQQQQVRKRSPLFIGHGRVVPSRVR